MSDALNLAMTITAADMFSGVLRRFRNQITGTGEAAKKVQKDYDRMVDSVGRGVKAIAVSGYIVAKMRPGVAAAAALQAEMIGVRAELSGANTDAAELAGHMADVKKTAFVVQAVTPFDIGQVVALEKELIKAGAKVQEIIGEKGAAAAAAALATYERMEPVMAGEALIGIGTPFQIAADGYADLADQISRAASASTVGAFEIAMSAKYAAGPMAAFARSKDEMLALVAMMAQVGVRGEMAGTSLKNFFLAAAKSKALTKANGDLKSTEEIIESLRKRTAGMGTAKKGTFLTKMFGEQGLPVALAMLNQGKGSFEEIVVAMRDALPLSEKLKVQMEGFNRQVDSLGGTGKSTLAILFEPALEPLTALIAKTNEWTAALGKAAMENANIGKTATYGAGGIALAAGGYGVTKLLQGGAAGLRMMKGMKGLGGTAAGVATGKALEAATGVTPVFVTNWPGGGGFMPGGPVPPSVKPPKVPPVTTIAAASSYALALAPLIVPAATVAAAAVSQKMGKALARSEASIKSTEDLIALRSRHMVMGGGAKSYQVKTIDKELFKRYSSDQLMRGHGQPQLMRGEVVVRVKAERGTEARTEQLRANHGNMDIQAETEVGFVSGGAW